MKNAKIAAAIIICVSLIGLSHVFAGVTGTEGGTITPISYNIDAGGYVILTSVLSADSIVVGSADAQPSLDRTISGPATGEFPIISEWTGTVFIAQGTLTLGRIEIVPDSGYMIKDVVVDDVSKGPVASYAFTGTANAFHVVFAVLPASSNAGGTAFPCWLILLLILLFLLIILFLIFFLFKRKKDKKEEEKKKPQQQV